MATWWTRLPSWKQMEWLCQAGPGDRILRNSGCSTSLSPTSQGKWNPQALHFPLEWPRCLWLILLVAWRCTSQEQARPGAQALASTRQHATAPLQPHWLHSPGTVCCKTDGDFLELGTAWASRGSCDEWLPTRCLRTTRIESLSVLEVTSLKWSSLS